MRLIITIIITGLIMLFHQGCYSSGGYSNNDVSVPPQLPAAVLLPIPDRDDDPEAPREGWCGETSIQMAIAYYGKEISQKTIHEAGNSSYPDLHSNEIDTALNALGVNYNIWQNSNYQDLSQYLNWIKLQLAYGYPVISGIKIYPTKHPDWALDHFVLIVGYNEQGLYINTNNCRDGQILVDYTQLSILKPKYSFKSGYNCYFGRAITGLK
jgi:hypothetical protein